MRSKCLFIVIIVAAALTATAANRPIAMMVEVVALRSVEDGVQAQIAVWVAPEDRSRLGRDVMLWAELADTGGRVFRRGWALKIDDPVDPLHVETVFPGGLYVLRIDVEGAGGRVRGVWFGTVDFSAPAPEAEPAPGPESAPVTESVAETATATATATVQVAEAMAVSASGSVSSSAAAPASETVAETVSDAGASTAPASATDTVAVAATVATDPEPAPDPAPETGNTPVPDPASESAPASVLDADSSTAAVSPPPTGTSGSFSPGLGSCGPPCKVFDDCFPRVHLAVALDLHPERASETLWVGDMLEGFLQEVKPATGMAYIRDHHRGNFWVVSSTHLDEWIAETATGPDDELAALVAATIERLRSGGALLVVTDGLGPRSKQRWVELRSAAKKAEVSVFVAGLWRDEFASGIRKDLRKLADATGGSVFYLQGPEQADVLIDRFVSTIDE